MAVGEQSDWLSGAGLTPGALGGCGASGDCRSDLWMGFTMGPAPANSGDLRAENVTCVSYPINMKSESAYGVAGEGPNKPIQSAHSGGAHALFADGSVHFLSESLDINILYNLANRNDGNAISAF